MLNIRHSIVIAACLGAAGAAGAQGPVATFDSFSYEGRDARFAKPVDHTRQYLNPIVAGYYPDPSVCRVGDTYYMVNSTFSYFPGVPVWKSNDLVNWTQLGHALDRLSQVDLDGQDLNLGIYAPQISYNPRNKTYYMTTGDMGRGFIFYVKTTDPAKGWSEPIRMKHGGMDTSFFFDTDGRAWVVYNADPFEPAKYNMQKAIHMNEFDWRADTICDKTYELTTGSTCIDNPIWIEGPHLYKIGKYYYLMAAESGTGYMHSEVIFRTRNLTGGQWEECPHNPILTQRDLGMGNRQDEVSSTGHADLVQAPDKSWWAVFLGCRPYEGDLYNTGRETFLLPVTWKDGWPTILPPHTPVPTVVDKAGLKPLHPADAPTPNDVTGNYSFTDRFETSQLNLRWVFLREPAMQNYDWQAGGLRLTPTDVNLRQQASPTALLCRQCHTAFMAETTLRFEPTADEQLAGMAVFQNEEHHFVVGRTRMGGREAVVLQRVEGKEPTVIATAFLDAGEARQPLRLKVEADGRCYSFSYAVADGEWKTLVQGADGRLLSTNVAGGFVGTTIGPYATLTK